MLRFESPKGASHFVNELGGRRSFGKEKAEDLAIQFAEDEQFDDLDRDWLA